MPNEYSNQTDYIGWVKDDADSRQQNMEDALRAVFSDFLEKSEVDVIVFSSMTALDLAEAIIACPIVLKPLLAVCSIGARALERDLSIKNVDTYSPNLSDDQVAFHNRGGGNSPNRHFNLILFVKISIPKHLSAGAMETVKMPHGSQ